MDCIAYREQHYDRVYCYYRRFSGFDDDRREVRRKLCEAQTQTAITFSPNVRYIMITLLYHNICGNARNILYYY